MLSISVQCPADRIGDVVSAARGVAVVSTFTASSEGVTLIADAPDVVLTELINSLRRFGAVTATATDGQKVPEAPKAGNALEEPVLEVAPAETVEVPTTPVTAVVALDAVDPADFIGKVAVALGVLIYAEPPTTYHDGHFAVQLATKLDAAAKAKLKGIAKLVTL